MFGYVRPLQSKLSEAERTTYQAAYCGLCRGLKERCGWCARFILNYDFVFLFLLLDNGGEECRTRRCPVHPWEGRPCLARSQTMDLCAWESVILAYYKLADGVADESFFAGLGSRMGRLFLKRAYKKAHAHCPDFDDQVAACLWELDELERASSPKLDAVADTFARLLSAGAPATGDESLERARRQLLYHLGRWIYLIDAWDDLAEDEERDRYNPIAARFGQTPDLDYLATTLNHSLALAQSAFQLLPVTAHSGILENILYLGLPNVQALVQAGKWGRKERK